MLTRISHTLSAADADCGPSAWLRSFGLLAVGSTTPSSASLRAPCIRATLCVLATRGCEKCGLADQQAAARERCLGLRQFVGLELADVEAGVAETRVSPGEGGRGEQCVAGSQDVRPIWLFGMDADGPGEERGVDPLRIDEHRPLSRIGRSGFEMEAAAHVDAMNAVTM